MRLARLSPLLTIATSLLVTPLPAQQSAGRVFSPRVNAVFPGQAIVSYERLNGDRRELQFTLGPTGKTFSLRRSAGPAAEAFALPDLTASGALSVYSGDLDWRPVVPQNGRYWFTYIASDDKGLHLFVNYITDKGELAATEPLQLAFAGNARAPRWSPDGRHIAFVSDSGVLHVVPEVDRALQSGSASSMRATRIAEAGRPALYPAWHPLGTYIAYQVERDVRGTRVFAIDALPVNKQTGLASGPPVNLTESLQRASAYRPTWSPDSGKYVAFFTDREAGADFEGIRFVIALVEAQTSRSGQIFRGALQEGRSRRIAEDVLPTDSRGPEWTKITLGNRPSLAIVYVQRDEARNNPVTIVGTEAWLGMRPRAEAEFVASTLWGTANHKDVSAAVGNRYVRYAYVAVAGGGEKLETRDAPAAWANGPPPLVVVVAGAPKVVRGGGGGAVALALILPGAGQFVKGSKGKGAMLTIAALAGGAIGLASISGVNSAAGASAEAAKLRDQAAWDKASDDYNSKKTLVTAGAGVAAAAWLFGIVDAAVAKSPTKPRLALSVAPELPPDPANGQMSLWPQGRIGLRIPFGGAPR